MPDSVTPNDSSAGQQQQPSIPNSTSSESSSNPASTAAASSKAKQTKSRNGCITCKLKRLKCDEKKPGCDQCAKRSVRCGGYKKDFKWRPFDDQNVSQVVKPPSAPKPRPTASAPPRPTRPSAGSPPGKSPSSRPKSTGAASSSSSSKKASQAPPQQNVNTPSARTSTSPASSFSTSRPYDNPIDPFNVPLAPTTSLDSSGQPFDNGQNDDFDQVPYPIPVNSYSTSPESAYYIEPPPNGISPHEYAISEAHQPAFTAGDFSQVWNPVAHSFPPGTQPGTDLNAYFPLQATLDPQNDMPLSQEGLNSAILDDDVEEILRSQADLVSGQVVFQNQGAFFPFQPWDQTGWSNPLAAMFQEPRFAPNSVEMLVSRFDRRTCGIMSIKDGPSENPWRTLFLPLMHTNRMMFNAVMAMACLHSAKQEPVLLEQGKSHFETAFKDLQMVGRNGMAANFDMALAAMLALAFGESWGWSTSSGIDYVKKSRQLMYWAIRECHNLPRDSKHLERLKFLCKTWIYIDVIARLTSVDNDESYDFENITAMLSSPQDTTIDPLMGCASTLFPVIGRVANLVRRVCKVTSNPPALVAEAANLKVELEAWLAPLVEEIPEDESTSIAHSLQTAEAYRWATLLYLHQAVPELPSHSSADLARQAMTCIDRVPLSSRAVIVQIYPLLAAGCEADTPEDRNWVQGRWNSMEDRMAIGNVDRCAEVVREVWRRRDEHRNRAVEPPFDPSVASQMPVFGYDSNVEAFSGWEYPFATAGGRATFEIPQRPKMPQAQDMQRGLVDSNPKTGLMFPEFTVRGKLHWVGVMKDWNWEVLLG